MITVIEYEFNQYPAAYCFALAGLILLAGLALALTKRAPRPVKLRPSDIKYIR